MRTPIFIDGKTLYMVHYYVFEPNAFPKFIPAFALVWASGTAMAIKTVIDNGLCDQEHIVGITAAMVYS